MYYSNSFAITGHELPSEAERGNDWRGVINWKNSSCWWNQGENYCGKSSSLVSVPSSVGESPGPGSAVMGTPRVIAPVVGEAVIQYTLWKSLLGEHGDLACVSGCEEGDGTPGFVPGHLC